MKIFLRVILSPLSLIRLLLVLIFSIFFLLTVLIEDPISKITGKYTFWSSMNWGKWMLFIAGIKVKRNNLPKLDKFLLMPNHRSYIDIFLMAAYSPSTFVAKAEILRWPLLGQSVKAGKVILVKREEMKSLLESMKKIQNSIQNQIPITIFPEGTTSRGPGLLPFKKGTFKIAAELNVPIIPCAISYQNMDEAWIGDDTFIGHFFRERWRPISRVVIRFGEPISGNDFPLLKENVKNAIAEMLQEIQLST